MSTARAAVAHDVRWLIAEGLLWPMSRTEMELGMLMGMPVSVLQKIIVYSLSAAANLPGLIGRPAVTDQSWMRVHDA